MNKEFSKTYTFLSMFLVAALLAGTDISSFAPGRVRVYNLALAGNEKLARQLTDYVKSFAGITDAVVNLVTGSMLITYTPEELARTRI